MSESQTKAGNQECFCKTCKTCKTCKLANLQNLQIDPLDMLNNFCFHVNTQKSLFINLQNLQTCKTCKLAKLANWSLGHAEQLLFSCLCSKVTVHRWKHNDFFFGPQPPRHPLLWVCGSQSWFPANYWKLCTENFAAKPAKILNSLFLHTFALTSNTNMGKTSCLTLAWF